MEIAGNQFIPFFGTISQTTLASTASVVAYKMSKADVDPATEEYNVTSNAGLVAGVGTVAGAGVPGAKAAIPTNRICTIKLTQASFDPLFNPWGTPIAMKEGDFIRLAIVPYGLSGFALNAAVVAGDAFLFPACLIIRMPWRPDADAGQPIDIELRTVAAYSVPGETAVSFAS